jgi:signal transduction histidine kinase
MSREPGGSELERAHAELVEETRDLRELLAVFGRLAAERDLAALCELILSAARDLTRSDAGWLYLVEAAPQGGRCLRGALVQNDSVPVPVKEIVLAVESDSVIAHVARSGEAINLPDALAVPAQTPFRIERPLDEPSGYRAKSLLVVPMSTPAGETVGVLQLINRKADRARRFASLAEIEEAVLPFSPSAQDLASALASQGAVAIANARLWAGLREALLDMHASQPALVRSERLQALAQMARGVAHGFNNVLAVVLGRTQLLLREVTDPELERQIGIIEQVAQDGAYTVRRVQEFARVRQTRPFETVDLNAVVREALEATRPRWSETGGAGGATYEVAIDTPSLPPIAGDPDELRETLLGLLENALDAMPRGGRLAITTRVEAGRVACTVADTGVGMAEATRERIFEPFFTTKSAEGTGLGLSVAYGIVRRHGGEIEVASRPGQGSAFTVRFPIAVTGRR